MPNENRTIVNLFAKITKLDQLSIFSNMSVAVKKAMLSGTVLLVVYVTFAVTNPVFLDADNKLQPFFNQISLLQQIVSFSIVGYGLTFCLICGGTDLSAGSVMAWAGIICVWCMERGVPLPIAIIAALGVGILTGIFNGFTIEVLGIVPFIATLGTQWVYRGLANVWTNGLPLYTVDIPNKSAQRAFFVLGAGRMWDKGIPWSVLITIVYGIILLIVLSKTRIGRQIYACGSNLEAAKLSGINAVRTRMFAYCVSGFSAALCGILLASRIESAMPTAGTGYELEAIAAAVVGGVSINGGEGSIGNVMIGAIMMGVLRNGFGINRVSSFWQQTILGLILIGACALEARRYKRST